MFVQVDVDHVALRSHIKELLLQYTRWLESYEWDMETSDMEVVEEFFNYREANRDRGD